MATARPGTRANTSRTRVRGPDVTKQFPVYFNEDEMIAKEGSRIEHSSMEQVSALIDKSREYIAVPMTAAELAKAKAEEEAKKAKESQASA